MRIRTLWFTFFVMLMLLLPPLFAQRSPGAVPDPADAAAAVADAGSADADATR